MTVQILTGDCRDLMRAMPEKSVQCCVTSPPYFGLRDYGVEGQIGLESTPGEFVAAMVEVFREVRRVLKDDGTLWLNLGDSYASGGRKTRDPGRSKIHPSYEGDAYQEGLRPSEPPGIKPKDLIGIPWRVAFALQADGWYLRQDIIWHKPNPMPESVRDRCTKAHEYIFLMSKSERYFYDQEATKEPAVASDLGAMGGGAQRLPDGSNANGGRNFRGHLPGNKSHKGTNAYHDGAEEHRTKEGLVRYSTKVNADPSLMLTRNKRSVWSITTKPFKEAHFATFPPDLPEICIKAGSREGDTVLDPFGGAGTTGLVANRLGRNAILTELNPEYAAMARRRIEGDAPLLAQVTA